MRLLRDYRLIWWHRQRGITGSVFEEKDPVCRFFKQNTRRFGSSRFSNARNENLARIAVALFDLFESYRPSKVQCANFRSCNGAKKRAAAVIVPRGEQSRGQQHQNHAQMTSLGEDDVQKKPVRDSFWDTLAWLVVPIASSVWNPGR